MVPQLASCSVKSLLSCAAIVPVPLVGFLLCAKVCLSGAAGLPGEGSARASSAAGLIQSAGSRQMAHIEPFRALRYDPARVAIPEVATQPYDKITPAMQEHYYSASPYNLVRIIL